MSNPTDLRNVIGSHAVDADGSKIGKIGHVYLDDRTGEPQWVTVKTGMFGGKESFAPLYGSRVDGGTLVLAVSKDLVKDAPNVEDDGHLQDNEVDALFTHYSGYVGAADTQQTGQIDTGRNDYQDTGVGQGRNDVTGRPDVQDRDTSGPTTDDAMTRSEEQLHVGTENVQAGRARLRKYVVEENVSTTVPVSHEEVRVEREPITDANRGAAMSGGDITEEEHEVTLHAERPVTSKETVPVERVKLGTETVTEDHEVNETVRKEQIDDPDVDDATHRDR